MALLNLKNASGSIAEGGQPQSFYDASYHAEYLRLVNPADAAESIWYNDMGEKAGVNDGVSEELPVGATMVWRPAPAGGVSITAATTGHAYRGAKG